MVNRWCCWAKLSWAAFRLPWALLWPAFSISYIEFPFRSLPPPCPPSSLSFCCFWQLNKFTLTLHVEAELADCQLQVCVPTSASVCVCVWEKVPLGKGNLCVYFRYLFSLRFLRFGFLLHSFVRCSTLFMTFHMQNACHIRISAPSCCSCSQACHGHHTHHYTHAHTRTTNVAFWLSPTVAFSPLLTLTRLG